MGNWDLMMKNVYSLGATSLQSDKFRLNIKYLSDTTGVYLSYLPEPSLKNKKILTLVGLDRLDNNNKRNPNGYFDYVDGYTIDAANGRVYFPVAEPFGENLRRVIGMMPSVVNMCSRSCMIRQKLWPSRLPRKTNIS